jgi:hypothetical protein
MSEEKGRVLVSCPTYAGKEYCLPEWKAAFDALTYEPRFAYQVDNTRVSLAYFERLKEQGISATHLTPWPDWDRTFKKCWDLILARADELDCYWIFSVEADNVPAPESLGVMVDLALAGNCHLVTHAYPMHATAARASGVPEDSFYYNELGCMLMTRSLLRRALDEYDEYGQMVIAIEATNDRYMGGRIKLTQRFTVGHLDGYEMAFANLLPSEYPGLIYPVDSMPADTGTVLPPSLRDEVPA